MNENFFRLAETNMSMGQRRGQAYYNALHTLCPQIALDIAGTEVDPFYNNDRLDAFFCKITTLIDNDNQKT